MKPEYLNNAGDGPGMKWRVCRYDSLGQFVERMADKNIPTGNVKTSQEHGRSSFFYFPTFEQCVSTARKGWKEGREKMTAGLDASALITGCAPIHAAGYDVAGDYPCAARAACGEPASMVHVGLELARSTPIIRLMVSGSFSSSTPRETIIRRGAAILSWVDALENAGARCELLHVWSSSECGRKYTSLTTVKGADEALSIDTAAFALANPDMLRRLGFRDMEQGEGEGWPLDTSFGVPADFVPAMYQVPHSVYFGALRGTDDSVWQSPQNAVAYVEMAIRKALRHEGEDSLIDDLMPQHGEA